MHTILNFLNIFNWLRMCQGVRPFFSPKIVNFLVFCVKMHQLGHFHTAKKQCPAMYSTARIVPRILPFGIPIRTSLIRDIELCERSTSFPGCPYALLVIVALKLLNMHGCPCAVPVMEKTWPPALSRAGTLL